MMLNIENMVCDRCIMVVDSLLRRLGYTVSSVTLGPDDGGFAIFAGLEQALDYVEHIHFDGDDIAYLRSLGLFTAEFLDYLAAFRSCGPWYPSPVCRTSCLQARWR